jgi:anti-sigma regulatory factor (Ser/Thr protein kinase)
VTTNSAPSIVLRLVSSPAALSLVRSVLAEVGELLALDQELLDDLKTTVSEACNNVVMHAYPSGEGALEILVAVVPAGLEVRVRDEGRGIEPGAAPQEGEEGLGFAVLRALTQELDVAARPEGGTEVRMVLAGERDGKQLLRSPGEAAPEDGFASQLSGDAVASVSPAALVGGLMGRLARAIAANVGFSLDRFSDIYLVTDALAAHVARSASSDRVGFAVSAEELRLELVIGPCRRGSGERLSSKGMWGPFPLALLSDELAVEPLGDHEELVRAVLIDSEAQS